MERFIDMQNADRFIGNGVSEMLEQLTPFADDYDDEKCWVYVPELLSSAK